MIRFADVTKVFRNGYIGLESVSFNIDPGELVYLVGESGAGKTTLMRLLIREVDPTSGDIYFGEQNILTSPKGEIPKLRQQIGVVFQDYQLIPDRTIYENIALVLEIIGVPKKEVAQRIHDVLELVGIPDKEKMFPIQLSGGELQRAAIARALVTGPQLLFADEPTGNLDQQTGHDIMGLLQRIQSFGTTVIVATHDPGILAKFPSRELRLKQGKLIGDSGAPKRPIESKESVGQSDEKPASETKAKKKKSNAEKPEKAA